MYIPSGNSEIFDEAYVFVFKKLLEAFMRFKLSGEYKDYVDSKSQS
jgi:hypothetical protein